MKIHKIFYYVTAFVFFFITSADITVSAVSYSNPEEAPAIYASLLMESDSAQVIQHENGYEKVPVGTLVKMMTVLLTAEAMEAGIISSDTMITASAYAGSMTQATIWLVAGEKMSAADLLKSVIVGNANDASVALAEAVYGSEQEFVKHMNTRAFELGMRDTVYMNCTGYDDSAQYSTAYDTAILSREILKHDVLRQYMTIWLDYVRDNKTELVNENSLVRTYESACGIKAGHSQMSGNCIAFAAEKNNSTYIAVVLGCADCDERFSIAKSLVNTGFSQYQTAVPVLDNEYIPPIKVRGGVEEAVGIEISHISALAVPKGRADDISCVIILPDYINAPVRKNQKIGCAFFYLDDMLLCSTDIMAADSVENMTVKIALWRIYTKLFE